MVLNSETSDQLRFFNLELALKCCLATWFVIVSILIAVFGWSGLGANQLVFPGLVCLPVATFFVVFFFGQELSAGCWSPSLWVDKLCVHQTNLELKAEQIASLPVFVAHSSRMLILWDETYFESWRFTGDHLSPSMGSVTIAHPQNFKGKLSRFGCFPVIL